MIYITFVNPGHFEMENMLHKLYLNTQICQIENYIFFKMNDDLK